MKFALSTFVVWGFKMTGKVFDMDKIQRYVERFIEKVKVNRRYDMNTMEWTELVNSNQNRYEVIATTFHFGYAKGYRAAMAEMKKGGKA